MSNSKMSNPYVLKSLHRWEDKLNSENILTALLNASRYFFVFGTIFESDEKRYDLLHESFDLIHYVSTNVNTDDFLDEVLLQNPETTFRVLDLFALRLNHGVNRAKGVLTIQESFLLESTIERASFYLSRLKNSYGIENANQTHDTVKVKTEEPKKPKYLTVSDRFKLLEAIIENNVDFSKILPLKMRNEIVSRLLNIHPETAKDLLNRSYTKGMTDSESNDLLIEYLQKIKVSK
jgi:hypothetical protein